MSESLTQATYERLLEGIVSGKYPPASRLVNRTLAEDLGVSVVPVREALGRLSSDGVVEHIPGAGSFVRALDDRELAKLYALREQLEAFAVVEATRIAQPYQVERLKQTCQEMAEALDSIRAAKGARNQQAAVEKWIASDAAFHAAIIAAADNPWLTLAVDRLRVLAHIARAKPRNLAVAVYEAALKEHEEITRAIERRDAVGAESLMRSHIERAMNAVFAGTHERA